MASFEAIESDLDELTDPDGLESAMAIDDQGNFLAWMDSERGMAPVPIAVSEFEVPVAQDLNAPTVAKGSQGFKRFTPPVPAVEATDQGNSNQDEFKPSSDAIDAVFAELEASAKASAVETNEAASEVQAHADVESDSDIYAEAHSEDRDEDQDEDTLEAKVKKPKIDPLALEDAFESVPFDLPELMGEAPVAFTGEVETQAEVLEAEAHAKVEAQADAPEVEAQAEVLEAEAVQAEAVQAEAVQDEATVIPEGEPVEPVAAWKKPAKPKKKQPSEFGIDEVPLEALLEVANTEAEDEGNYAEAEAVTSDLQPEADALAAVGLGEANLEEGILAAYEMEGAQISDLSALIESGKALENSAANQSFGESVNQSVATPVHAGFAAEQSETPEAILDALETSVLGFETPEIQPLDAELETDSSVAAVLAPEIMNVPMMPATTTLRRHFDATDLLEAQIRLRHALRPLEVPMLALLGRAAERCSLELPGIKTIALAELGDKGIEISAKVKAVESFREVLAGIAEGSSGVRGDLSVVDISDLGLDEVVLPLAGPHLLLTRLSPHPDKPGRMRGTVSLSGLVNLRAGASFLDQVVSKLEAPITLMV